MVTLGKNTVCRERVTDQESELYQQDVLMGRPHSTHPLQPFLFLLLVHLRCPRLPRTALPLGRAGTF